VKLALQQLCKRFDAGHPALDGVSLRLEKVHTLVLIGPSGGGKSTLLRIIAGLEHPDSGTVEINGERVIFEQAPLLQHRRTIGTVFQAFNLFPHLTALQNITLPLEKVHGHSAAAAEEIARRLLVRFRLENHARRNYPAASASALPSPGPFPSNPGCCFLTSPPPPWTRK
jgi:polar amino acid transport system ATP-binding protein